MRVSYYLFKSTDDVTLPPVSPNPFLELFSGLANSQDMMVPRGTRPYTPKYIDKRQVKGIFCCWKVRTKIWAKRLLFYLFKRQIKKIKLPKILTTMCPRRLLYLYIVMLLMQIEQVFLDVQYDQLIESSQRYNFFKERTCIPFRYMNLLSLLCVFTIIPKIMLACSHRSYCMFMFMFMVLMLVCSPE